MSNGDLRISCHSQSPIAVEDRPDRGSRGFKPALLLDSRFRGNDKRDVFSQMRKSYNKKTPFYIGVIACDIVQELLPDIYLLNLQSAQSSTPDDDVLNGVLAASLPHPSAP